MSNLTWPHATQQSRTSQTQPQNPHTRRRMLGMARQPNDQRLRQTPNRPRPQRTSSPPHHIRALHRPHTRRTPVRPHLPQSNLLQPLPHGTSHRLREHETPRPQRTPQNTLPPRTRIQRKKHSRYKKRQTSMPRLRQRTQEKIATRYVSAASRDRSFGHGNAPQPESRRNRLGGFFSNQP